MKLLVGNRNYSSWSLRAFLALRAFEIPFETELVRLDGPGWKENLRARSPTGRVPVLLDGPLVLPETLAIIEYVAERFPDRGIWPADRLDRADARAVSAEMHAGFADLRRAAPMNLRANYPGRVAPGTVAADLARIEELWGRLLGRSGGPFLYGRFTAADAMYAPVATRIRTYGLPASRTVQDYVEAIYAHPAFQEWFVTAIEEPWVVEEDEVPAPPAALAAGGRP